MPKHFYVFFYLRGTSHDTILYEDENLSGEEMFAETLSETLQSADSQRLSKEPLEQR